MKEKELRRSQAVLPIGTVMKLTNLSARQIRYYEEQGLVIPERNEGNRRMYSLNDIDKLLEIKDFLADGINMAGIKRIYEEQAQKEAQKQAQRSKPLTDEDVRRILRDEFINVSGLSKNDGFSFRNNRNL
ncbi:MerR family transcriptional regulator [Ligilactobacillus agilis]|jgi:MerR family transcriptional regulator, glutamine synthetase repressor|uniref:Glutamine synthetase repressor n=2 Tax=Ligilactobacillus agilis TaxID=1601 RepID=A0A0R2AKN0_9LACO|nr:MerR family transcriptional regulator [Ligilactobacillus agilis]KRM63580.1 glutamine synthetase repressor [Ligilactobacillus agilis DSM 20509]MBL1056575.1 MerR family transcriptional regulator [Ligilactobacillus agilis]MBM6762527.1 MerR family transcriptional regulator [Ligilactobacillus agilis]MBM6772547.1 MerR family transcriptional regulator [Ligilactobacillus agilis]MCI5761722.1 MerR family transcriptional regulator [Ligilactobacillus agilis]